MPRLNVDGFCATCHADGPAADLVPLPGRNQHGQRVQHLTCAECRKAGLEFAKLRTFEVPRCDLPRDRNRRGQA